MLKTKITYRKDPAVAAKKLKAIVAEALAWVIKYRHGRILKNHFTASAGGRYHYKRRTAKYVQRKMRKFGHQDPLVWSGDMKRQIYWWKDRNLPDMKTLQALDQMDGMLIDPPVSGEELIKWQDRFAEHADDLILISFADEMLQRRWLQLTVAEDYYFEVLPT